MWLKTKTNALDWQLCYEGTHMYVQPVQCCHLVCDNEIDAVYQNIQFARSWILHMNKHDTFTVLLRVRIAIDRFDLLSRKISIYEINGNTCLKRGIFLYIGLLLWSVLTFTVTRTQTSRICSSYIALVITEHATHGSDKSKLTPDSADAAWDTVGDPCRWRAQRPPLT